MEKLFDKNINIFEIGISTLATKLNINSQKVLEVSGYLMYAIYVLIYSINITTIINYSWSTIILNSLKIAFILMLTFKLMITQYNLKHFLCVGGILGLLSISYLNSGYADFIQYTIVIIALKDLNISKIIRNSFFIKSFMFITTICLSLTNIIESQIIDGERSRHYLGYFHPNMAMTFFLSILLDWCLIRKEKFKWTDATIIIILSTVLYKLTDSRTSFMCILMLIILMVLYKTKAFESVLKLVAFPLLVILCIFSITIPFWYNQNYIFYTTIDKLLSWRLAFIKEVYEYIGGYNLFGNNVDNIPRSMDNGYFYIIIIYGIAVFLLINILFLLIVALGKTKDFNYLIPLLLVIFIYSFFEHLLTDIRCNSILLFASVFLQKDMIKNIILNIKEKNKIY